MPRRRNVTDPEEWDESQWAAFDREVLTSCLMVLKARELEQRGLYHPSEGQFGLTLLEPWDFDRQLAARAAYVEFLTAEAAAGDLRSARLLQEFFPPAA